MKAIKIEAIPIFLGKGRWTWFDNTGSLDDYARWLREAAEAEITDLIRNLRTEAVESVIGRSACDLCCFWERCAKF